MVDDGAVTGSRTVGAPGKGELLKQVIVDRIRSGAYPVGHRLGSVRKAAVQFQVHPNTLSRVYRELAEDGILRTAHGSGTYVLAVPGSEYGDSGITQLATALVDLAEQAAAPKRPSVRRPSKCGWWSAARRTCKNCPIA
jgi:DNA-binding transcriptional regulator YhcF (GntR family)